MGSKALALMFTATASVLLFAAQPAGQFRDNVHQAAQGRIREFAAALSASHRSGGLVMSKLHDTGTSPSRPSAVQRTSGAVPWTVIESAFASSHPGYSATLSDTGLVKVRPVLPNACVGVLQRRVTPGVVAGTLDDVFYRVMEIANPALKKRGRGTTLGGGMADTPARNTTNVSIELTYGMSVEDAMDKVAASVMGTVWLVVETPRDGAIACLPTLYTREATSYFAVDLLR